MRLGGGGRAPPRLPGDGGGGVEARGGRGTEAEVEQTFAEDFLGQTCWFPHMLIYIYYDSLIFCNTAGSVI